MRSDKRSLGLGMVIAVTLGASLLLLAPFISSLAPRASAMDAAATAATSAPIQAPPTQASIPALTATFTPIAPSAVAPNLASGFDLAASLTPDPIAASILDGGLVFSGPLPAAQQVALYRASLNYVQASVADSVRAAKEINGVGYGDPSNICGPLAIAILRDAGVIGLDVAPHDYWLLDPAKVPDQRLIAAAFPPARFMHEVNEAPLNKVDWTAAPLQPGDFLFIWHGSWGNFDHMLVVNRVDSGGRAYAVTNFGTPEGYLIAETMLYDPVDPQAGIFHTWTKERDAILGSTGFGGYEIWRARSQ
ncbi:MAG: hypothetical protein V1755_08560 [Chloroflexota bacterium]